MNSATTSNPVPDLSWRKFPQFERIFEPEQTEPFLRRVERTCRQLQDIAAKGSPAERDRARAALTAFERALALVKEISQEQTRLNTTSGAAGR